MHQIGTEQREALIAQKMKFRVLFLRSSRWIKPLISVITPTYNRPSTLCEMLESLFGEENTGELMNDQRDLVYYDAAIVELVSIGNSSCERSLRRRHLSLVGSGLFSESFRSVSSKPRPRRILYAFSTSNGMISLRILSAAASRLLLF